MRAAELPEDLRSHRREFASSVATVSPNISVTLHVGVTRLVAGRASAFHSKTIINADQIATIVILISFCTDALHSGLLKPQRQAW